jgi:hypothetical protein
MDDDIRALKEALAALDGLKSAVREIHHATTQPNWFTNGEHAARQHRMLWIRRGLEFSKAEPAEDALARLLARLEAAETKLERARVGYREIIDQMRSDHQQLVEMYEKETGRMLPRTESAPLGAPIAAEKMAEVNAMAEEAIRLHAQTQAYAARYRWLRMQFDPSGWHVQAKCVVDLGPPAEGKMFSGVTTFVHQASGDELDADIDAAMKDAP